MCLIVICLLVSITCLSKTQNLCPGIIHLFFKKMNQVADEKKKK
jgi:hypothetical protein